MTRDLEREVSLMCNLSKGIEDRGMEKGLEQGLEQGHGTWISFLHPQSDGDHELVLRSGDGCP